VAVDPDFLLQIADVEDWQRANGPLPEGGWLLYRTGWSTRSENSDEFLNADESGPHTPGISAECARWLADETGLVGVGVETVGTDAGQAAAMEPAFPCHHHLLGAGKLGLTQLQNLDRLPATGIALAVLPLPIVGGSGSPARVVALVEK
jgi:kynurenine formamidase